MCRALAASPGASRAAAGFAQFDRGGGRDLINSGLPTNSGPTGELDLGAGIATDQTWLQQTGSDLTFELMSGTDQVTVAGWFSSTASQLQQIVTTDGSMLDTQVNLLVNAMATFQSANPGFDHSVATQAPANTTLQNALAAAWHH